MIIQTFSILYICVLGVSGMARDVLRNVEGANALVHLAVSRSLFPYSLFNYFNKLSCHAFYPSQYHICPS
jgi:hypothetical protein